MIKNSKQLKIDKVEVSNLQDLLRDMDQLKKENSIDLMKQLQYDIYKRRIQELTEQIKEYESLVSGKLNSLEFNSTNDNFENSIVSFRLASGLTQKELADKIEVHEQQIQRYEQQDYLKASFERVIQLLKVLGVRIILRKEFKQDKDLNKFSYPLEGKSKINEISKKVHARKALMVV
jgi:ribosome-binding protein aMBF1 (putative translation factor)